MEKNRENLKTVGWKPIVSWVLFALGVLAWGWMWPLAGAIIGFLHWQETNKIAPLVANIIAFAIIFLTYLPLMLLW